MSLSAFRLVKDSNLPAFAVDESNRITTWNAQLSAALNLPSRSMVGRRAAEVLRTKDAFGNRQCPENCALHEMARNGEAIEGCLVSIVGPDGEERQFYRSASVLRSARPGYQIVFVLQPERRRQTADAIAERLLFRRLLVDQPHGRARETTAVPGSSEPVSMQLTGRQRQVLKLVADGRTTGQIASDLRVSANTVRHHMQNILEKLQCHSQAEAVAKGIRQALI